MSSPRAASANTRRAYAGVLDRLVAELAHRVHPDPYGLVPAVIERRAGTWRSARAARRA